MWKRICFMIIAISFIQTFTYSVDVTFAERSVQDCIDAQDCVEEQEEVVVDTDGSNEEKAETSIGQRSIVWNIVKMVFALAVVLALIYFLSNFLKKRNQLFERSHVLQNLGGVAVGQNKSVQLVRIGDRLFVLGVGENVQLLKEITDPELIESLLEQNDQASDQLTFINKIFQRNNNTTNDDNTSFINTLQEELENVKKARGKIVEQYIAKKDDDKHV